MAATKEVACMMPGEERPCCDNCAFIRGDYENCHCSLRLNRALNRVYELEIYPNADGVLDIVEAAAVDRGDFCSNWRWYGDE